METSKNGSLNQNRRITPSWYSNTEDLCGKRRVPRITIMVIISDHPPGSTSERALHSHSHSLNAPRANSTLSEDRLLVQPSASTLKDSSFFSAIQVSYIQPTQGVIVGSAWCGTNSGDDFCWSTSRSPSFIRRTMLFASHPSPWHT